MDNKESWHTFHSEFIGKGGYLKYTQSQDFEVPPYVWPENLTADYDDENKVTLTWDARKVHGEQGVDYIMKTGGAYEIIRSTDPEFLVYDHLPDLLYVPEKDSYKFERSEEHTSELQSLMRISYAVFCLKKKNIKKNTHDIKTI